jgi:hypothetical protein
MRKWWFSIVCWAAALVCAIYPVLCFSLNDYDTFVSSAFMTSSFAISILLVALGIANRPEKD